MHDEPLISLVLPVINIV